MASLQKLNLLGDFENSIDWTISITGFSSRLLFAETVNFDLGDISVLEDNLGVSGSYKSQIQKPEIAITLFSDKERVIESELITWSNSAFGSDGTLVPSGIAGILGKSAIRAVTLKRYDPGTMANIGYHLTTLINSNVTDTSIADILSDELRVPSETLVYECYLERVPAYRGTNIAGLRMLEIRPLVISKIV